VGVYAARRDEGYGGADEGREREERGVWDEEQGRVGEYGMAGRYPPTNEEEEQERRVQEVSGVG
jgi:hypothetical protein